MKKLLPLFFILAIAACRPVHNTKLYYEEYVNPKASVDYEDTVSTDLPQTFLDEYYTIDSKLVRLTNQLDLLDGHLDSAWIQARKEENPWIRHMALLDAEALFIAGDDTVGFDPALHAALAGKTAETGRSFLFADERTFLISVVSDGTSNLKTFVAEIDMDLLCADVPERHTLLYAGGHLFATAQAVPAEDLADVEGSTRYAGSISAGKTEWNWVRSMAANNLVYLFANQE